MPTIFSASKIKPGTTRGCWPVFTTTLNLIVAVALRVSSFVFGFLKMLLDVYLEN
jgi:hypothetical protein